jgi:hypothetical protein
VFQKKETFNSKINKSLLKQYWSAIIFNNRCTIINYLDIMTLIYKNNYDLIKYMMIMSTISLVMGIDDCKDRRFVKSLNTSYMQFTKEIVSQEYAVKGEFKGLHCCAKGYNSLEW